MKSVTKNFTLKQTEDYFKKNKIPNFIFLYFDEKKTDQDEFINLLKKIINPDEDGIFLYLGNQFVFEDFFNNFSSPPLFGGKRLFIIKDINSMPKNKNDEKENADKEIARNKTAKNKKSNLAADFIEELNKESHSDTYLIITNQILSPQKTTVFFNKIMDSAQFLLKAAEPDLSYWIIDYAAKNNKIIDSNGAALLRKLCNEKKQFLKNELDKLILYSIEQDSISVDTIKKNVQTYNDENIFNLIDNILKKNYASAIKQLRDLLRTTPIQIIIYNLIEKFNSIIIAKKIISKLQYPQINTIINIALKDYNHNLFYNDVKNILTFHKSFGENEIKKILKMLVELDTFSKSTFPIFVDTAMEIFIKKICGNP